MRIHAIGFRLMRLRAPSFTLPATADIGHPTAKSQQAGLDHLVRVAVEQAAARLLGPVADSPPAADTAPIPAVPYAAVPGDDGDGDDGDGDDGDWTPRAYWHT